MLTWLERIGRQAAMALRAAFPDAEIPDVISIERSAKADLQTAAAMQLAKAIRRKPREIAEVIAQSLTGQEGIARVEIAGPGFVNLTLDDAWIAAHVADGLSLRRIGEGQTVVIDYSSPNVAKPMHIGHIRSTIIGEAVKRTLRAVGYTVIADNHLGDWGTQFGKLIVAYRKWLDPAAFERDAVAELLRLYVKFVAEEKAQRRGKGKDTSPEGEGAEEDAETEVTPLLAEARAELVKLQQGDPENLALWKKFVAVSMAEFDRIYRRLGVQFDVVLGESFYNDRLPGVIQDLLARGIAEESEGAIVVTFSKERDGEAMPPLLVRKADGGYLYGSTDVATMLYREETWHPTRTLILTDERQQLHFRQLAAVARRLGLRSTLEHVWFGLMRLPEGTISTRDGNLISLEALLDEAERRATIVAKESNPELSDEAAREVGRVVGLGAVKYNDLSRDRQSLVTFTWDKALSLTGNTAPYLQYAYARIRSMIRKAGEEGYAPGDVIVSDPSERALALRVLGFSEAVEQVAATARPHILCEYLFELATTFSTFYNAVPVLKAPPELRASRLRLAELTAEALARGLDLLGIEVLERM